jgi:DNA invertase Pin-like site-specific DNA recombinase
MERIKEAEAGFRSLTEAIDTTTAPGRMMMQMVGAFAEFERAILRERTKAGLDAARKHGRVGGRRPKLRPNQQDEIVTMVSTGTKTAADAARPFSTFIRPRCRGYWLGLAPGLLRRRYKELPYARAPNLVLAGRGISKRGPT